MEITVSARHIDISPALRAAAEEKFGRLSRFGAGSSGRRCTSSRSATLASPPVRCARSPSRVGGRRLRAQAAAADAFAAVDLVVEKLEHQLHSLKTKVVAAHAGPRGASLAIAVDD